jgi:LCP family protein required for cell wall assembly
MKLIPRTRLGSWWRIALATVVVIGFAAGTTTVAGLLQVKSVVNILNKGKALKVQGLTLPAPGKPETILLIGADHRTDEGNGYGNTDTMMLVRINDNSSTINLLSVPRDLQVRDPNGDNSKVNAVYSVFGPNALLHTLSHEVFPGLKVNHMIIVTFLGFSKLVDKIGCVYAAVDHRYYNDTAVTGYSSIDIQPGYQRLCGDNAGAKGALAFVRFRHLDSDLVREQRQQDFIRWAKQNFTTGELVNERNQLLDVFAKHSESDTNFHTSDSLLDLANLLINANGNQLKSIPFPVSSEPMIDGIDYVESTSSGELEAYKEFMRATPKPTQKSSSASSSHKHKHKHHVKHNVINNAGTTYDPGDGKSQTSELSSTGTLGTLKLPIYYPTLVAGGYEYCFTITGNCTQQYNPSIEYKDSYPRRYTILAPDKKRYASYVFTMQYGDGASDDYYTVQGTTWRDPPLLRDPTGTVHFHGRTLHEFENGGNLSVVSFSTKKGVYWVSNTLEDAVPNSQMLAIAASFTPAA